MASHVVRTQPPHSPNNNTPTTTGIFSGLSFFLVQRLPQRSDFIAKIHANGGRVVKLEAQADHIIADHARSDCPAGSISWKFIDAALASGTLPDPSNHPAGPPRGTQRPVGSAAVPAKGTRTPFTAEDDRTLWLWVERCKREGGLVKGNEIYKQLAATNARHTYQSWRDRYVSRLMHKPPAGVEVEVVVAANPPPTPPTAGDAEEVVEAAAEGREEEGDERVERAGEDGLVEDGLAAEAEQREEMQDAEGEPDFTADDVRLLLDQAGDVEAIAPDDEDDAWKAWAGVNPEHSADSWRRFYAERVRPLYLRQLEEEASVKAARRAKRHEQRHSRAIDGIVEDAEQNHERDQDEEQPELQPASLPRPESPASTKRKRKLAKSPSKSPGRKKLKPRQPGDEDLSSEQPLPNAPHAIPLPSAPFWTQPIDLIGSDDEDEENQLEEAIPTSEPNKAAHMQLDAETLAQAEKQTETSALNSEAQEQFDRAVFGTAATLLEPSSTTLLPSNLPTSDANRAADEQLRREAQHAKLLDLLQPNGRPLTEANLASQQKQHQAQLLRGADLPEDDDVRDEEQQDAFVEYLQGVTGTQLPRATSTDHRQPSAGVDAAERMPQLNLPLSGLEELDDQELANLPLASQQEIDEAFEANINWPASPEQRGQSPRVRFETQVAYPALPAISAEEEVGGDEVLGEEEEEVHYPLLPEQSASLAPAPHVPEEQEQVSSPFAGSQLVEGDSSYVFVDQESEPDMSPRLDEEDEIDLSIPDPEGGWELSSSPAKVGLSQGRGMSLPDQLDSEADEEEDDTEIVNEEQDIIQLSSQSSSSSSSPARSSENSIPAEAHTSRRKPQVLETQDILNAETQQPDLAIPLPPDSDEDGDSYALPSDPLHPPSRSRGEPWSKAQDKLLLKGIRKGMSTAQILRSFPLERSKSALRSRRVWLLKRFPAGYVPSTHELYESDSSSSSEESQSQSRSSPPVFSPPQATAPSQRNLTQTQQLSDEDLSSYIDTKVLHGYAEATIIAALKHTSLRPELAELVLLEWKAGKGLPEDVPGVWSEVEDDLLEGGDAGSLRGLEKKHGWRECEGRMGFLRDWRDDDDGEEEE